MQNFSLGRPGWHEGSKNSFGKTFENVFQILIFFGKFWKRLGLFLREFWKLWVKNRLKLGQNEVQKCKKSCFFAKFQSEAPMMTWGVQQFIWKNFWECFTKLYIFWKILRTPWAFPTWFVKILGQKIGYTGSLNKNPLLNKPPPLFRKIFRFWKRG